MNNGLIMNNTHKYVDEDRTTKTGQRESNHYSMIELDTDYNSRQRTKSNISFKNLVSTISPSCLKPQLQTNQIKRQAFINRGMQMMVCVVPKRRADKDVRAHRLHLERVVCCEYSTAEAPGQFCNREGWAPCTTTQEMRAYKPELRARSHQTNHPQERRYQ
jgi:hypothetical protein